MEDDYQKLVREVALRHAQTVAEELRAAITVSGAGGAVAWLGGYLSARTIPPEVLGAIGDELQRYSHKRTE
jgi:hypothetical protein